MLFNSYEFLLVFLPITLIFYYKIAEYFTPLKAKCFLVIASLVFYSYWDIANLPILLVSILVNYSIGHFLEKKPSKKLLFLGIAFNLAFLGYFKYTDFFIQSINEVLDTGFALYNIALPLGISFFTFTQTAYLVDVYRGETKEYSKSDYLLFVTIFPHLIAGPILYHKDMIPQFSVAENYKLNYKNLTLGLTWFTVGLFKKVVIADKLAEWANIVFSNSTNLTTLDAWGGTLAYTLQLYFDFSGYSEMAIGLGLMLNYNLPLNFNYPYRALSIIDFWRRWHMTLSAFLKNYLYIPLGGNRTGHHMRNILITMFLGGLWHGAGWTFVFWGILHGVFICVNHLWRKTKIALPKFICWLLTFNAVNIAWVFFRANSFTEAVNIIKAMVDFDNFYLPYRASWEKYIDAAWMSEEVLLKSDSLLRIILFLLLSFIIIRFDKVERLNKYFYIVLLVFLFVFAFLKIGNISEFLYFQF